MSEDTRERHRQANKEKVDRLQNAGQVKDFLESRLRREISTKEVAACMVLVEMQDTQTRKAILKEVGEALCCLVGNTMLADMEAGKLLGEQLGPIFEYARCQKGGDVNEPVA